MQLSKNFSVAELVKSQTATRLGIDNSPSEEVITNLTSLCNMVLQKVRNSHAPDTSQMILKKFKQSRKISKNLGKSWKSVNNDE